MSSVPQSTIAGKAKWTRALVIVVRLALLVFLVWALFSARFSSTAPIAEDSSPTSRNSRTVAEPSTTRPHQLS